MKMLDKAYIHLVKKHTSVIRLIMAAVFVLGFFGVGAQAADAQSNFDQEGHYTLGVVPFVSLSHLADSFAPVIINMRQTLGKPILLRSSSSFGTFMENLKNERYDIAYMQSLDFVRLAHNAGYVPITTSDAGVFVVLVVASASAFSRLDDLKGKTVGLASEVSALSYMTKFTMKSRGIDLDNEIEFVYLSNNGACLFELFVGGVDACAMSVTALNSFQKKPGHEIKVLAHMHPVTPPLLVVHSRMSEFEGERLYKGLLRMSINNLYDNSTTQGSDFKLFSPLDGHDDDDLKAYWEQIDSQVLDLL